MKLNIGAGKLPIKGYVNVDINSGPGIDVVADTLVLPFENEIAEELAAKDVLEHTGRNTWRIVLYEWCRVLKPGGVLKIRFPDIDRMIATYQNGGYRNSNPKVDESDEEKWRYNFERFVQLVFGHQDFPANTHTVGLNQKIVEIELKKLGMTILQVWFDGSADCRITAVKGDKPLVNLDHPDYAYR